MASLRTPKQWLKQIFAAKAAKSGGVVRRKIESVERFASLAALEQEVRMRGFHMVQVGDQLVILCNKGKMQVIV